MDDDMGIFSYVMSHLPYEWVYVPEYTTRYVLFTLFKHSPEYQTVKSYFHGATITLIQRIQNPFQFGRFILRREMLQSNYEGIVFHGIHRDDLETALKFNCDYRRYQRFHEGLYENGQHPKFFNSFSDLLNATIHPLCDIVILVLKILTHQPLSQCDYFIQYIVKF